MEDTLGEVGNIAPKNLKVVLILVLMEDTLGVRTILINLITILS